MNEIKLLKESVLKVLSKSRRKAMTEAELINVLNVGSEDFEMFSRLLKKQVKDGDIVLIHGERYAIGEVADLIAGVLSVSKAGNGYLAIAGREEDLFIPQRNMGVGLPGDRVLVRMELDGRSSDSSARIGRVIEVLERKRHDIVGTLKTTGRFNYVVPIAPGYSKNFYVDDLKGAKVNDRVVVRFIDWVDKSVNPEGAIVDVIGSADDPSVDTISIIKQYELPEEFPVEVIREAEEASALMGNPGNRMDLRDKLIITIDPETARDFDDALSLEYDAAGNKVLGVHIADVSHFVTPGSALDTEARKRGNSVYLPDLVIPMLPEQLSNGVCSLRPDEDRLAFSVFMTMDASGVVIKSEFARTIIRSKVRFTYEEAMSIIEHGDNETDSASSNVLKVVSRETKKLLYDINSLAKKLRSRRFAKHALVMNLPECEVIYDGEGHIKEIRGSVSDESHELVEECMVAANEAVDIELSKQGMLLIHRYHAKPNKKKIDELKIELEEMGFAPGNLNVRKNLAKFMKQVQGDPLAYYAQIAVLRSMSRAVYSASEAGHYGLAKSFYAHFTSPIRRYPDLVVHRQLGELLSKNKSGLYNKVEMDNIATGCSMTERNAEEAERELIEIKKFRFLASQLKAGNPDSYDAVVSRITNFGMFVDVPSLQLQGLVHVSTVSDKFVRHDAKNEFLRAGKMVYKRGTEVKVVVSFVDFDKSRIDFTLATSPKEYFSRRKNSGKRKKTGGKPWHADVSSGKSRGKKSGGKKRKGKS